MKNAFSITSRLLTQKLSDIVKICDFCSKWFLLNVNPKPRFWGVQIIRKDTKNVFKLNLLSDLGFKFYFAIFWGKFYDYLAQTANIDFDLNF